MARSQGFYTSLKNNDDLYFAYYSYLVKKINIFT